MKPGLYHEQKCSQLLSKDENDSVIQLLGPKCQSLSMAVVQLFSTDSPESTDWRQKNFGILSFVRDPNRKSYYFRLYCPIRHQLLWEHEMYNGLQYQISAKFFHCFEAEECIVGFNFASEDEATNFEEAVIGLQKKRRVKRLEQRNKAHNNQNNIHQPIATNNAMYGPQTQINGKVRKNKAKNSKNKKYTKDQIGMPENFRHVQHIGWDPDTGFDLGQIKDPQLNTFFAKAGVSESQLRNPQTREFIYNFIDTHGGIDAIKDAVQDSPVPPPLPTRFRQAPPPPPPPYSLPLTRSPAPPPPRPINVTNPPRKMENIVIPPPPPPLINSVPPPPPPPHFDLPKMNTSESNINKLNDSTPDPRSALLEAIRSGKTLKPIDTSSNSGKASTISNQRSDLLDQIRQGVELKSVQPIQKKTVNNLEGNGLAGALARALAERARVIHSDSSTSESSDDDEDDEWDD
ncbi:actin nucleation-promoting factor WASL-like [Daktulosphaira vitifoliae]|uniref:actin nucleation-promoting factor WASL-like n=1 Tax=Daktulosphaira vitifoliae TaxID=58002 RepID=UPI0021A9B8E7|nr:actin nucleation-promoting factor WASL-like [Daktulosphaira vitifoliae]